MHITLRNLHFNTLEETDLENMLKKSFHPVTEKFSCQTFLCDVIKYYTSEKNFNFLFLKF